MRLTGFVMALCWCGTGLAQNAAQTTIRTSTGVVQVNVVVRDRSGPVTGLNREDFRILDRGKARPIEYFQVDTASMR